MARFADVLHENPAPRRLGDVRVRFEPSMLIGETAPPSRGLKSTVAWLAGISALLFAVGALVLQVDLVLVALLAALGAAGLLAASVLRARQRRFVVNFETNSLRLDFSNPITGRPRTMVVHFDGVRAVDLHTQVDGTHCLTVDFVPAPSAKALLREVLAAYIGPGQLEQAQRLQRVLEGAFGLGEVPEDSPVFDEAGTVDPTLG